MSQIKKLQEAANKPAPAWYRKMSRILNLVSGPTMLAFLEIFDPTDTQMAKYGKIMAFLPTLLEMFNIILSNGETYAKATAKNISIVVALVLLAGCYTQRKAENSMDKAKAHYPEMSAKWAGKWYPPHVFNKVTEKTLHDTLRFAGPTVFVNCDSVLNAAKADPSINTKVVGTKCPDLITLRERIFRDSVASVENTARVEGLELEIVRINGTLAEKETTIVQKDKEILAEEASKKVWKKYALITWGIIAFLILLKLFGGYIKSLIPIGR